LSAVNEESPESSRRKQAEQARTEPQSLYRLLFDSNPMPMWAYDCETLAFLEVNEAAIRQYGYAREEFLAMRVSDLGASEDTSEFLDAAVSGMTEHVCEHRTKDGRVIRVAVSCRDISSAKRRARLMLAEDVTNRRVTEAASRESERRFRLMADTAPVMLWLAGTDGLPTFYNRSLLEFAGRTLEEEIRDGWVKSVHPDDLKPCLEKFGAAFGARQGFELEYRLLRADGQYRWVLDTGVPRLTEDGEFAGYVGSSVDITDRKSMEEALKESEERYALAALAANDGLWDWNLRTGEVYFSPRWKNMAGHTEDEIGGEPSEWMGRLHPDDAEGVRSALEAHLAGRSSHLKCEYRLRHKDGTYRWMLSRGLVVRDAEGRAIRMAGSQADVTARKQAEEQLVHDALHDALTQLPNRVLFMDRLKSSLLRVKRRGDYPFAVLFLDLDRFKSVNDSLGHTTGDQLLAAIARRLEKCVRESDTVARLGGDEFGILLDDGGGAADVSVVAERIHAELRRPFDLNGTELLTSVSIGICLGSSDCEQPGDLLRDADMAMYRAKSQGKARYEIFDSSMRENAMALMSLETDLRGAVERRELRLHYQPIVLLETGRVTGFEALVRWQHPSRGLIPPAEFIPIAEETGSIFPIGLWVLRTACRQMRAWHAKYPTDPPLTIAVNLSGKQCTKPDLVEQIAGILRDTEFDPRCLKLEITEGAFVANSEHAIAVVEGIRKLGAQFHLDDFGTGYSSLSYLRGFPVEALKIDRSFITRLTETGQDIEILRTILALAGKLRLGVIAEGVESEDQLEALKSLGCEHVQGYHLSKPVDRDGVEALLKAVKPSARKGASPLKTSGSKTSRSKTSRSKPIIT
jgi:diguanylate cyclase (GGDEF)-like protein/PAS domain S-box-containing protein